MQGLETPYDTEVPIDFIDCSSCNKSIRSETLYKIHLTTIGHMKKEEALVANGLAIRSPFVPDFEDIMQYLQYLNLDEPIIGLNHLEEVIGSDPNDSQPGPRYFCRLCSLEANLPNMINHIIGRKHRQKYLTTQRKDLVTWDHSTSFTQPAKVIRAKSEVVERQDGRGMPRQMSQIEGKSNVRVPQKQRLKNVAQNAGQRDGPYAGPAHHSGHYPRDEGQPPPFHPDDPYLGRGEEESGHYQRQNNHGRQDFMNSEYQRDYSENPTGSRHREDAFPQAEGRHTRGYREEMPHREAYQREASPHRRLNPECDPLKQFYSEELRRKRSRANDAATADGRNYPSHEPQDSHQRDDEDHRTHAYPPEGANRHHPDSRDSRGSGYPPEAPGRGSMNYTQESASFDEDIRRGASAPEESYQDEYRQRSGYPEDQDGDYSGGCQPSPDQGRHGGPEPRGKAAQPLDRDYLFEMVGALRNRAAVPPYQTPPQGDRGMSEIPEPFRRFLQRDSSSQDARKRKSRFSDATQEEMEGSKRMLMELDRPRVFEEPGSSWQRRQEGHGSQRPDQYTKSQSQYQTEGYPEENEKDGSKVFDLLKNIEIENGEEADFLKSRLCNLLKEFQAKKSEKTLESRPDSAPISREYNHRSEAQRPLSPPRSEAGREAFREEMQWRPLENQPRAMEPRPRAMEPHPRPMETHLRSSLDPRGWEDEEQGGPPAERFQENRRPVHMNANVSSRQRYEEVFGSGSQVTHHRAPHAPHQEEPFQHRDHFQHPRDHYGYSPGVPESMGAASHSYHREQGYQMPRGTQQSSSLDKITSTLLELVARK